MNLLDFAAAFGALIDFDEFGVVAVVRFKMAAVCIDGPVDVFDGSGDFSFTNSVSPSVPSRFFLLELP